MVIVVAATRTIFSNNGIHLRYILLLKYEFNTHSLSVSKGIFRGTAVNPLLEQSTVVPTQLHTLGHLVPPNEKWAMSSNLADEITDASRTLTRKKVTGVSPMTVKITDFCISTYGFLC